ncbi:protein LAZ1 [Tanacetum coccineum]
MVSPTRPKTFKFSNILLQQPRFREIVLEEWQKNISGFWMYKVVKRLKLLKRPLRKLLYDQGNIFETVKRLRMELDSVQLELDSDPTNYELREEEAAYLKAFNEASRVEERFLQQKAKVDWLKLGDANTAYFYKVVKSQASRNRIDSIMLPNGECRTGDQVPIVFIDHYTQFLGQQGITGPLDTTELFRNTLSNEVAAQIICDIFYNEIQDAIFSMGDKKFLGPDGYSAAFFKDELNHTIIVLIPKVATPLKVNDYRPISCCNVLFKYISKILSNRMKNCLNDLVSLNQSAFVPGRRISDNILSTQELMHNYHLDHGPPRRAFKVDIQKAYDTVDWDFLRCVLVGFGFHPRMIGWIMECVTSTSFSLNINGSIHGYFKGKRGLWQGDPMSPYLFTLVMEILTPMLHRRVIMDVLEEFKDASGLVPSLPKSTAYFCNVLNYVKLEILGILPFEEELEQSMRGFLWCQGDMRRGKAKVAWDSVCLPKAEGGIGIRSPLANIISNRNIYEAGLHASTTVNEVILNGSWLWPSNWSSEFSLVNDMAVPTLNPLAKDKLYWKDLNNNEVDFSVAVVWNSIRPRRYEVGWYKLVWFPHHIPRHAFHAWLVIQQKLKTQDMLKQWDVGNQIDLSLLRCALCNRQKDSHDHLFFTCSFSAQVWNRLIPYMCVPNMPISLDVIVGFLEPLANKNSASVCGFMLSYLEGTFKKTENVQRLFQIWKLPSSLINL